MRHLPMILTAALALSACALPVVRQNAEPTGPETPIRGTASKKPSTPTAEPRVFPSLHPNGHPVIHGYWVTVAPTDPYLVEFDSCFVRHTAYRFATDGYGKVKLDVGTQQGPNEGLETSSVTWHMEGEWIESQLQLQGAKTTRSNTQDGAEPVVEPARWTFVYDQTVQHLVSKHDDGKTHLSLSRWPEECGAARNPWPYGKPTPSPTPTSKPSPSPSAGN